MLKNLVSGSIVLLVVTLILIPLFNSKKEEQEVIDATYNLSNSYDEIKCQNILIIPKINLNKCMNINDVSKDIAILYDSNTIVLASHSGNAHNAYFKNLYKLKVNDEVIFYHQNLKSKYKVREIKTKLKSEQLTFENKENQLILVTCSYKSRDEQLVYYLEK